VEPSGTECEKFNRQVYAKLDLVIKFENKYQLADPKSITTNTDCNNYDLITLIEWLHQEHADFVKDHEWPALATKLPQTNTALRKGAQPSSDKRPEMQTCYNCDNVGHIAPNLPQKNGKPGNVNGATKTDTASVEPSAQHEYQPMASWNYIEPTDLTKDHTDDDGNDWKLCTQCACKATKKKGYFTLSHFDSEHKADWKAKNQKQTLP
jgi:hypothetical protein